MGIALLSMPTPAHHWVCNGRDAFDGGSVQRFEEESVALCFESLACIRIRMAANTGVGDGNCFEIFTTLVMLMSRRQGSRKIRIPPFQALLGT